MDKIWTENSRLVIGIDIGATCSAVSYVHLAKGTQPQVQRVTKWPGQNQNNTRAQLPSWIWYNSDNKPVKYGAEAFNQDPDEAADRGLRLVKYFKLHLHPDDMRPAKGFQVEPLPYGLTISQVYAAYLGYVFNHTREFFQERNFRGKDIWSTLTSSMEIVLAHPNGWGTREQGVLRSATVAAGILTAYQATDQISFVTEAEASIQFCLNTQTVNALLPGMNLVVCDAGGSTVDTTVYCVAHVEPMLELNEIKASACIQAGGMFVDDAVECFLCQQLESADLEEEDSDTYITDGLNHFIDNTKPNFDASENEYDIKFGGWKLNIPSIKIRSGRMKLPKATIKSFFDICTKAILKSVESQSAGVESPYLFLVGGFGDSPYLKQLIGEQFASNRLTTCNDPGAKAVADGAAIWAVTKTVRSRATRYSYGVEIRHTYNAQDPEHTGREKHFSASGSHKLNGGWSEIVAKDTIMDVNSSIKHSYHREYYTKGEVSDVVYTTLYATCKPSTTKFMRDKEGDLLPGWAPLCKITENLKDLKPTMVERHSSVTGTYWVLNYDIAIRFGGTQLSASIEWVQDGKTMAGPAIIIPNNIE